MLSDCIDYIHVLRAVELERVLSYHRSWFFGHDLLEIGSGSGFQLNILASICRSAYGLDLASSGYRTYRTAEIIDFDGRSIPFPDASFDVIFTSHVLQYLIHEHDLYKEMRRVLRPGGVAVHVVPTSLCHFWSSVLHYPAMTQLVLRKLLPKPQECALVSSGESEQPPRARRTSRWVRQVLSNMLLLHRLGTTGNWFTEFSLFQSRGWRRRLARHGWRVERVDPLNLWYSMHFMLRQRLSIRTRTGLARALGSSAITILAKPMKNATSATEI